MQKSECEKLSLYEINTPQHCNIQLETEKQTRGTETCTENCCTCTNVYSEGGMRFRKPSLALRGGPG